MADANSTLRIECRGGSFLIDESDQHIIGRRRPFISSGYVILRGKLLHRLIMCPPRHLVVDHINGDGLDNRRANLRICTQQQNLWNGRSHTDSAVRYRGVSISPDRPNRKWRAQICHDYRVMLIGRYDTAEEAARAYDEAASRLFGNYARLNFPINIPAAEAGIDGAQRGIRTLTALRPAGFKSAVHALED